MPYFDKKEDVLDIKLTPYGRHLMSKGKLMPKYYAFLDDDVIYDSRHVNDTETNSEIKTRIIDETPSLKPMYTFNSLEAEIDETETFNLGSAKIEISAYSNEYFNNFRPVSDTNTKFLQNTLGTSKQGVFSAPRWDITLIDGDINSAVNHTSSIPNSTGISSPSASVLFIPQIECDITYNVQVKNTADEPPADSSNLDIQIFDDGTYLDVEEEQILADILEKHGFIHDDSFEIEVFKYEDGSTTNFRPLKFINKLIAKDYRIDKDIFIEDPTQTSLEPDVETVEYYFDLRVDEEIPKEDLCGAINELKSKGIYINDLDVDCPDVLFDGIPDTGLPPSEPCGEECD
jgi:hypothetical protein